MNSNPSSLQEVKDFAKKYPDPIVEAGIKLEGVGEKELRNIPDNGKVPELEKSTNPDVKQFKDYVKLPASGEGNCFLYAWSVFLTGRSDENVQRALRVAIVLWLMNNYEKASHDPTVANLKYEIVGNNLANNYKELEDGHVRYLEPVLKRRLGLLSKVPNRPKDYGTLAGTFQYLPHGGVSGSFLSSYSYPETWIIYNSGGHYQPLIKK